MLAEVKSLAADLKRYIEEMEDPLKGRTLAPIQEPKIEPPPPVIKPPKSMPQVEEEIKAEKVKVEPYSLDEVKKALLKIAPSMAILDVIPDDKIAKEAAERWRFKNQKKEVYVIYFQKDKKELIFLQNLSKAIDTLLLPAAFIDAAIIEKENGWETFLSSSNLKLIIACENSLQGFALLRKHFRKNGSLHFLKDTPLFLVGDLNSYFEKPLLKKELWNALSQKIASVTKNGA